MNQFPRKTSIGAVLLVGVCLLSAEARAATVEQQGSAIVIGPDTNATADPATRFDPSQACVLPPPPIGNAEQAAISHYQEQRQKFMDCVARDPNANQQNLDRSLAAIGDAQSEATAIIQQETRGAIDKAGLGGYRH